MEQYQLVIPGDVDSTPGASVIANSSFLGDTKYTLGIRGLGWKPSISSFLPPPPEMMIILLGVILRDLQDFKETLPVYNVALEPLFCVSKMNCT